jgi:hypothetical protein
MLPLLPQEPKPIVGVIACELGEEEREGLPKVQKEGFPDMRSAPIILPLSAVTVRRCGR